MKGPTILKATAALAVLVYCLVYGLYCHHKRALFTFQELSFNGILIAPSNRTVAMTKTTKASKVGRFKMTVDDIFISVKTSQWYHYSRLPFILKTWYQMAKQQTWFFTDTDNHNLENVITAGHVVNTNCSSDHNYLSLCCKMSVEFRYYIKSSKKWFCHFDDDNYVNIPRLVAVLQKYNSRRLCYLGKKSVDKITIKKPIKNHNRIYRFSFATGGAGFCISKSLALLMFPLMSGGKFYGICQKQKRADDVILGFIIETQLRKKLKVIPELHSHLENLNEIPFETIKDQITFSYSYGQKREVKLRNIIEVPGFELKDDPTRFLSVHCILFPETDFCAV